MRVLDASSVSYLERTEQLPEVVVIGERVALRGSLRRTMDPRQSASHRGKGRKRRAMMSDLGVRKCRSSVIICCRVSGDNLSTRPSASVWVWECVMAASTDVVVPLVTAVATLGAGWLVTTRVTDRWDMVKKRRDLDMAAARDFQLLYGEFMATWRSWECILRKPEKVRPAEDAVWTCFQNAAATEGKVEALLSKVASERLLSDDDINLLGGIRQGFQSLRKAIRDGKSLNWWSSSHPEYAAFKGLCSYCSEMLGNSPRGKQFPSGVEAARNFRQITSNRHEGRWVENARRLQLMGAEGAR